MSKGPGRVMRLIDAAIDAEPERRFTYAELKAIAYDGRPAPTHNPKYDARLVVVQRVVHALVLAGRVSLGVDTRSWVRTVRGFDPKARSSASVIKVQSASVSA